MIAAAADPLDTSLIYDRASSLRALGPGRSAFVPIFWSNWCPVGFANSGGLVFMDDSTEEIPTL